MALSMRFTAFDFDASRYEAMLSDVNNLESGGLAVISGLIGVRAVIWGTCALFASALTIPNGM